MLRIRRRARIGALTAAVLLSLSVTAASGQTSRKDQESAGYLGWTVALQGPCGKNFLRHVGTWYSNGDYGAQTSGLRYAGTQSSTTGGLVTSRYSQNSVKDAAVFYECHNHSLYDYYAPLHYVHRVQFVNWFCNSGCAHTSTHTTGWSSGTLFDTSGEGWD